ncbi:MAG: hypothetical protein K6E37_07380 [Bacteroidales bacterium]|nr:hypothetical protein [Bacteroidales bacterium]
MKTFKIKMLSGCDCGCKDAELQIISKGISVPSPSEVKEALLKAGYKIRNTPAANSFKVI